MVGALIFWGVVVAALVGGWLWSRRRVRRMSLPHELTGNGPLDAQSRLTNPEVRHTIIPGDHFGQGA